MKIHSSVITFSDIHTATRAAGMRDVHAQVIQRGSRTRDRAFDVKLCGTSTRLQNPGTGPRDNIQHAATWDEWGMFINALFELDSDAIIGQYPSQAIFDEVTAGRFESLTAPYQHPNHKFDYDISVGCQACKFCDAQFDHIRLHTATKELAKR